MDWKNFLRLDALKIFIMIMLLIFPFIGGATFHSSNGTTGVETNFYGNTISMGLPMSYIKMDYIYESQITSPSSAGQGYVTCFTGSSLNFILDIVIAYFIVLLISHAYFRIKNRKK